MEEHIFAESCFLYLMQPIFFINKTVHCVKKTRTLTLRLHLCALYVYIHQATSK